MKAWLILQEGPGGTGQGFLLDPARKPLWSVGRSKECDITLGDHRASRHHSDLRWNGRQWEVVDRGSTNGTYVNGLEVHRPYDLRFGDRITIGETTLVLREYAPESASPARQAPARRSGPTVEGRVRAARPRPAPSRRGGAGAKVLFWIVQVLAAVAVVCLGAGAFLPWLKVSGSLSQELQPLVQGIAEIIISLSGQESIFNLTQQIGGLEGYGKLTLALAVVAALILAVDVFFGRKSVVPGIVYLGGAFLAMAAIGFDLINYYRYYEQIQSLSLLFGVKLSEVVQLFGQFIEIKITPMIGLPLTAVGLVLLLLAGIARLIVYGLDRR